MGDWYTIGLGVGLGAAVGVLAAGALAGRRGGWLAAAVAAGGVGILLGFVVENWQEGVGGAVGGVAGALGATQIVTGALRRGGTRTGTGILVGLAAVVLAGIAFVPFLGYVEAVALPALAARLRRRLPERYAGLRSLAK